MAAASSPLPSRWYPLRYVPQQARFCESTARFDVIEAGRRSGKTELVKRRGVEEAVIEGALRPGQTWFSKFCAPTRDQSKSIFWTDLKALSEPWWARDPSESDLQIFLRGGAEIWVCGLDKPARIEGTPCDRLAVDELANVKPDAWERHLRPVLDTERPGLPVGRAWLFGVPRPGTQFAELARLAKDPDEPDYAYHFWPSSAVLSPDTIEAARRTLDPRTFDQEYGGQRVSFEGMVYYTWNPEQNCRPLDYNPDLDLIVCLDFNVSPGTAAILQEQHLEVEDDERTTCVIGEVHIPNNSNTPAVCRKIIADWGHHKGRVLLYGDATGGSRHTSQTEGTDWDLAFQILREHFGQDKVRDRVGRSNPPVKSRINSTNARICNASGDVRMIVDPKKAPHVVADWEGVKVLKGSAGEVDKRAGEDQGLTHLSEAIGYYLHEEFPFGGDETLIY